MRQRYKVSVSGMILVTSFMRMRACAQTCSSCRRTINRLEYKVSAAKRVGPAVRIIQLIKVRAAEIRGGAV